MYQSKKKFTHNKATLIPPSYWTGYDKPDRFWFDSVSHFAGWFLLVTAGFMALKRTF